MHHDLEPRMWQSRGMEITCYLHMPLLYKVVYFSLTQNMTRTLKLEAQDKVAFRGFGESGVFAAIAKVATMPPIYNIQKLL